MARYLRPPWLLVRVVNPLVRRFGPATTLVVRTRTSGRNQRVPVNLLEIDGRRYLVSVRGDTQWVRNLRSAGTCELRRRGWVQCFNAVEVPPAQRPPILEQYRSRWGAQTDRYFAPVPDPADHPVFELHCP